MTALDDPGAESVKAAAGGDGKVSKRIANLVQQKLFGDAAAAAAAFDRAHATDDDVAWEAERLGAHEFIA